MQTAVIEYARAMCGLAGADSRSSTRRRLTGDLQTARPYGVEEMGGTMSLGALSVPIAPTHYARNLRYRGEVSERHRHRYEFNPEFRETLNAPG